jgi:hypothetical protein
MNRSLALLSRNNKEIHHHERHAAALDKFPSMDDNNSIPSYDMISVVSRSVKMTPTAAAAGVEAAPVKSCSSKAFNNNTKSTTLFQNVAHMARRVVTTRMHHFREGGAGDTTTITAQTTKLPQESDTVAAAEAEEDEEEAVHNTVHAALTAHLETRAPFRRRRRRRRRGGISLSPPSLIILADDEYTITSSAATGVDSLQPNTTIKERQSTSQPRRKDSKQTQRFSAITTTEEEDPNTTNSRRRSKTPPSKQQASIGTSSKRSPSGSSRLYYEDDNDGNERGMGDKESAQPPSSQGMRRRLVIEVKKKSTNRSMDQDAATGGENHDGDDDNNQQQAITTHEALKMVKRGGKLDRHVRSQLAATKSAVRSRSQSQGRKEHKHDSEYSSSHHHHHKNDYDERHRSSQHSRGKTVERVSPTTRSPSSHGTTKLILEVTTPLMDKPEQNKNQDGDAIVDVPTEATAALNRSMPHLTTKSHNYHHGDNEDGAAMSISQQLLLQRRSRSQSRGDKKELSNRSDSEPKKDQSLSRKSDQQQKSTTMHSHRTSSVASNITKSKSPKDSQGKHGKRLVNMEQCSRPSVEVDEDDQKKHSEGCSHEIRRPNAVSLRSKSDSLTTPSSHRTLLHKAETPSPSASPKIRASKHLEQLIAKSKSTLTRAKSASATPTQRAHRKPEGGRVEVLKREMAETIKMSREASRREVDGADSPTKYSPVDHPKSRLESRLSVSKDLKQSSEDSVIESVATNTVAPRTRQKRVSIRNPACESSVRSLLKIKSQAVKHNGINDGEGSAVRARSSILKRTKLPSNVDPERRTGAFYESFTLTPGLSNLVVRPKITREHDKRDNSESNGTLHSTIHEPSETSESETETDLHTSRMNDCEMDEEEDEEIIAIRPTRPLVAAQLLLPGILSTNLEGDEISVQYEDVVAYRINKNTF